MNMSTHLELFFEHRFVVYPLVPSLPLLFYYSPVILLVVVNVYAYNTSILSLTHYSLYTLLIMPRHSFCTSLAFSSFSLYSIHLLYIYHVETKTQSTRYKEGTFNPCTSSGKEGTYTSSTWSGRYIHRQYSEILRKSFVSLSATILISRMDPPYLKQLVYPTTRRMSPERLFTQQRYALHHL